VALIAPGAEYRARPSFADGSSAEKPATIEMLQRATAAGEVLFFARIFPTSVLADMVWALEVSSGHRDALKLTPQSIPFALPDKFWRTPQSRPLVGGWAEFLAFNLHDGWGAASRRLALRGFNWAAQPVVK
jgi:hypothetical protein